MAKYKNIVTPEANSSIREAVIFSKQILKDHNVKYGNMRFNGMMIPISIYSCYSDVENLVAVITKLERLVEKEAA